MARQSLSAWIQEHLAIVSQGGSTTEDNAKISKCTAFSLVHLQGIQQIELKTLKIGSRQYDAKELASMFESACDTYAGGVPGVQQFLILAFFDGNEKPSAQYPIRKAGEQDTFGLGTEAPTTQGLTQQLMRHNEALTRISASHSDSLMSRAIDIIGKQQSRIDRLEKEQLDTIELAKELVMQQASNEHGRVVEIFKMKQSAEDRKRMFQLAPAVINRITNREIFPQATADTALFEHLAESLNAEQIKKLAGILTPEQWGFVADRLVQVLEKKEKDEKETKQLEDGSGNGKS